MLEFSEVVERDDGWEMRRGGSRAAVARTGAAIGPVVLAPKGQDPSQVLFAGHALGDPGKARVSHFMMPVGPDGTILPNGKQRNHGPVRSSEFRRMHAERREDSQGLHLLAENERFGHISRYFTLGSNEVQIATTVMPKPEEEVFTSMGEHLYVSLGGAGLKDVKLNDETLTGLLGDGAIDELNQGRSFLWSGYKGLAVLNIAGPDYERKLTIGAHTSLGGWSMPHEEHGMLLWREREHNGQLANYLCAEPVVGVHQLEDGRFTNVGIRIKGNEAACLDVIVTAQQ